MTTSQTTNLHLTKAVKGTAEPFSIDSINGNLDILDEAVGGLQSPVSLPITSSYGTIDGGGLFKLGSLYIANIRFITTSDIPANTNFIAFPSGAVPPGSAHTAAYAAGNGAVYACDIVSTGIRTIQAIPNARTYEISAVFTLN